MSRPKVRPEPVLTPGRGNPDAPDNCAALFYGAVVREDGGRYRMWYYACHWEDRPNPSGNPLDGNLHEGPTCYAESDDGVHWTKPELGQVEWRGSRRNNVVALSDLRTLGVHVIRDDKDPRPARKYKMVYECWAASRNFWTVRTATSPDGSAWTPGPELPYDGFFEQASLYEFGGGYYINGHILGRSEGGHHSCRQGYALYSPDFDRWLPECADSFLVAEPADPAERGHVKPYDQVHIGTGATSFGNVLVGLYGLWHNHSYPTKDDWFGMGTSCGDLGLVVSNDGLHFREPVQGRVFLHRDESRPHMPEGVRYATVLTQGNGVLNVGDETRIYHGRWANAAEVKDYHSEIALATLPRDRWGALGLFPEFDEGSVWTAAVEVPLSGGGGLFLNADGVRGMRVEVADERFELLPRFSGADAGTIAGGDGLSCPVAWPRAGLAELRGRAVRFRVHLKRAAGLEPRLYAVSV
jgi:hypothetical protein